MKGTFAAAVVGGVFSCCASAGAALVTINVDINGAETSGTYSGLGAAPAAGTTWNGVAPPGGPFISGPLVTSVGTPTNAQISLGNYVAYDADENPAAHAPALLNDFIYQTTGVSTTGPDGFFSVTNLDPGVYNLYLYAQNGGYSNTTTRFTVAGISQIVTNNDTAPGPGAFVPGVNYVVYPGLVVNTGGTIAGSFNVAEAANNAAFNGLQLVLVPEPASAALLGLGAIFLLRRRPNA